MAGLFKTPQDVMAEQQAQITDPSRNFFERMGMLSGQGIANMTGGKTAEMKQAEKTQEVMKGVKAGNPDSMLIAAERMREAGNLEGAFKLEEMAQAQKKNDLANELTGLQISGVKAKNEEYAMARQQAAEQKAKAVETFTAMGNPELASMVQLGMPVADAFKMTRKEGINVDGTLVDKRTGEIMYQNEQAAMGLTKFSVMSQQELAELSAATGTSFPRGTVVERNNETGAISVKHTPKGAEETVPEGYELKETTAADGTITKEYVPIKGSPAWVKEQERQGKLKETREMAKKATTSALYEADGLVAIGDDIMSIIETSPNVTTGWAGAAAKAVPGTAAYNLNAKVDQIKSNKALKAMQEAKAAGATFGSMSNAEWEILERKGENLDPGQGNAQFVGQVKGYLSGVMGAMWEVVNNNSPEQLKEYGLESYGWLRGKPRPEADTYDKVKAAYDYHNTGRQEKEAEDDPWALPGDAKEATTKPKKVKWSDF